MEKTWEFAVVSDKLVFISWSGEASRRAARAMRGHLKSIVPDVSVFMSEDDIAKGARGLSEIEKNLANAAFGVIIVTKSNLNAPWINYEAGAIGKGLGTTRVVPILCDLTIADLGSSPLSNFQSVELEKTKMHGFFESLRQATNSVIDKDQLNTFFDVFYTKLFEEIRVAVESPSIQAVKQSAELEALQGVARQIQYLRAKLSDPKNILPIEYITPIIAQFSDDESLSKTLSETIEKLREDSREFEMEKDELTSVMQESVGALEALVSELESVIDSLQEEDELEADISAHISELKSISNSIDSISTDLMFAM